MPPDAADPVAFDTKIAVVLRDDLATWQRLNVTAFLVSGIVGAHPHLLGAPYEDASGHQYHALLIQPVVVLAADADTIGTIYRRILERRLPASLYIEDMFQTGHDAANRAAVRQYAPDAMKVVGLGLRSAKNVIDRVTKGARLHQ